MQQNDRLADGSRLHSNTLFLLSNVAYLLSAFWIIPSCDVLDAATVVGP